MAITNKFYLSQPVDELLDTFNIFSNRCINYHCWAFVVFVRNDRSMVSCLCIAGDGGAVPIVLFRRTRIHHSSCSYTWFYGSIQVFGI